MKPAMVWLAAWPTSGGDLFILAALYVWASRDPPGANVTPPNGRALTTSHRVAALLSMLLLLVVVAIARSPRRPSTAPSYSSARLSVHLSRWRPQATMRTL